MSIHKDGIVAEQGSPAALMGQSGGFARIVERQRVVTPD